jgi:hypothetical protein
MLNSRWNKSERSSSRLRRGGKRFLKLIFIIQAEATISSANLESRQVTIDLLSEAEELGLLLFYFS